MNWDAAGAIGEVVGAAEVVISVVYLALQVKKQTEESRLAATRDLSSQQLDFLRSITEQKELATIYLKGVRDYEGLPDEERLRISLMFQRGFRVAEQQFLHTTSGNLDPSYFESMNRAFSEWLTLPGIMRWWELSQHTFDERFQRHISELVDEGTQKSYYSTFDKNRDNTA